MNNWYHKDVLLNTLKESHNEEFERLRNFSTRLQLIFAVITLEFLIVTNFIDKIHIPENWNLSDVLYFIILILIVVILAIQLILFYKAFRGYKYAYLPTSEKINEYYSELEKYYEKNYEKYFKDKGEKSELIQNDFKQFLIEMYESTSTINRINNQKRSKDYTRTGTLIFINFMLILCEIVLYFFSSQYTLTQLAGK